MWQAINRRKLSQYDKNLGKNPTAKIRINSERHNVFVYKIDDRAKISIRIAPPSILLDLVSNMARRRNKAPTNWKGRNKILPSVWAWLSTWKTSKNLPKKIMELIKDSSKSLNTRLTIIEKAVIFLYTDE